MHFVILSKPDGGEHAVNLANVAYVKPSGSGGSFIRFIGEEGEHGYRETPSQVLAAKALLSSR